MFLVPKICQFELKVLAIWLKTWHTYYLKTIITVHGITSHVEHIWRRNDVKTVNNIRSRVQSFNLNNC